MYGNIFNAWKDNIFNNQRNFENKHSMIISLHGKVFCTTTHHQWIPLADRAVMFSLWLNWTSSWTKDQDAVMWNAVMMTSSNGNIFRVTGPLCGEFTGPGEFPPQRPVTQSFDVFFDLRPNKHLNKQPWGWWFEMPSWSLWRHCYGDAPWHHFNAVLP